MILFLGGYNASDAQINTSPYELVEIFRIGDEAGGDTVLIAAHENSVIAVNSLNQIFIGSSWPATVPVLVFSDEGHLIGFVGAKGEGPGEFLRSYDVVVASGDSIYVFDWELDRLSVFEPSTFRHVQSMRTHNPQSLSNPSELLGVLEGGYLFKYQTAYRPPGNPTDGYDAEKPRFFSVNMTDRQGNTVKSMSKLPAGERYVRASTGSISVMDLPFGRDPFFAHKNGLLYAGWNDTIEIAVISKEGEVIQRIEREHEPVRVSRGDVEGVLSNMSKEIRREILRSSVLPETKPAYDELVVDDQGHVWIREYPDTEAEFAKWLILGSDSKLIGEIELPTNLLLKTITKGRAYASVNSEDYGPYIVVYSIIE